MVCRATAVTWSYRLINDIAYMQDTCSQLCTDCADFTGIFISNMFTIITLFVFSVTVTEELNVTLTIRECTVTDAGQYTIKVTNEYGEETCSVEASIDFAEPAFITPLKDQNVTLNENVVLDCKYKGLPQPDIKWLVSGLSVVDSDKYRIKTQADKSSLEVFSVNLDDCEMGYSCRAVNIAGEATTQARLLPQGVYHVLLFTCYCVMLICKHVTDWLKRSHVCLCLFLNVVPPCFAV